MPAWQCATPGVWHCRTSARCCTAARSAHHGLSMLGLEHCLHTHMPRMSSTRGIFADVGVTMCLSLPAEPPVACARCSAQFHFRNWQPVQNWQPLQNWHGMPVLACTQRHEGVTFHALSQPLTPMQGGLRHVVAGFACTITDSDAVPHGAWGVFVAPCAHQHAAMMVRDIR